MFGSLDKIALSYTALSEEIWMMIMMMMLNDDDEYDIYWTVIVPDTLGSIYTY